ncbi:MAG: hypothetical protein RL701_1857 [Pseudomonadota bacterium]
MLPIALAKSPSANSRRGAPDALRLDWVRGALCCYTT